tara:strand:- start:27 stop:224 length:198 start_codon:yes stop_codon:yes gene_type:complete
LVAELIDAAEVFPLHLQTSGSKGNGCGCSGDGASEGDVKSGTVAEQAGSNATETETKADGGDTEA